MVGDGIASILDFIDDLAKAYSCIWLWFCLFFPWLLVLYVYFFVYFGCTPFFYDRKRQRDILIEKRSTREG